MATGRPQKPHTCSWTGPDGKQVVVPGLYHCPDGRWRINATGRKFTERDERRAVEYFHQMTRKKSKTIMVPVPPPAPVPFLVPAPDLAFTFRSIMPGADRQQPNITLDDVPRVDLDPDGKLVFTRPVDEIGYFSALRQMIQTQPAYVASMLGVSEQNIRDLPLRRPALRLAEIITAYQTNSAATKKAKREALAPLNRLIASTGAKTLDDLTTDKLLAFRREIEGSVSGPATRRAYYSRVKAIIGFGLKIGLDTRQIRDALDRLKVLWTAEALPPVQPRPIGREQFHTLLAIGEDSWRPWLLLGLNLCLHMEEVCSLLWDDLDLEVGTYSCIRNKTRRQRIPRAATLWPETVAALRQLPRRGPYVFISTHGTRYNKNTRVNDFRELRIRAGLAADITFDTLRDGAYTAAARAVTDERLARVLAGHRASGLQDNYVLRNPEVVAPACEAVYRAYGPFPQAADA